MPLKPQPGRRRYRLWSWRMLRRKFLVQWPPPEGDDLDQRCKEIAADLNRFDDRARDRDYQYDRHESPSGLKVGELDDPTQRELDAQ